MRILWISNSLHNQTGYGTQTRLVLKGLQRLGHTVANVAFYGIQGTRLTVDGVTVYPSYRDMWAGDAVTGHAAHFGAQLVVNFHDIWVLPQGYRNSFPGYPHAVYFPVDSVPAAPMTVARAKEADFPIVYSKFGLSEMEKAGVKCDYVPHAFDSDTFKPSDKVAAREFWGLPQDAYIVGMVAANKGFPSRKSYPECLQAFAKLREKRKDAILFLHTARAPIGHGNDGIYMDSLIRECGLEGAVYFTPEYLQCVGAEDKHIAMAYQAMDVLLNPSYGEGFGLAILEAQACGTPVIVQNVTSMPELVFAGWKVEPVQRYWNLLGCWQFIPNINQIAEALDYAYQGAIPSLSDQDIAKIRGEYSIEAVLSRYWAPVLESIAQHILAKRAVAQAAD